MQTKRIRFLDIAKGIGIICIILGHLQFFAIKRIVFTFHVPIFFLITGYFINAKRSIPEFVKTRARTLLVPYYVTCFVIIVFGTIKGVFHGDSFPAFREWFCAALYAAGDNYSTPFSIRSIGALWFLWATFWGSLFLRVSLNLSKVARIGFISILFAFGYFTARVLWLPLSIQAGACSTLFLYIGFLAHESQESITKFPIEFKLFCVLFSLIIWIEFIKNFKSFWFVHCDIGRGMIDVFGSICACVIVLLFAYLIDLHTRFISAGLAYLGKYSLLVLCIHIVELNLVPWQKIAVMLVGDKAGMCTAFIISGKLVIDLFGAVVLSRMPKVREIMGYSQ